jgi:hypothetical protein
LVHDFETRQEFEGSFPQRIIFPRSYGGADDTFFIEDDFWAAADFLNEIELSRPIAKEDYLHKISDFVFSDMNIVFVCTDTGIPSWAFFYPGLVDLNGLYFEMPLSAFRDFYNYLDSQGIEYGSNINENEFGNEELFEVTTGQTSIMFEYQSLIFARKIFANLYTESAVENAVQILRAADMYISALIPRIPIEITESSSSFEHQINHIIANYDLDSPMLYKIWDVSPISGNAYYDDYFFVAALLPALDLHDDFVGEKATIIGFDLKGSESEYGVFYEITNVHLMLETLTNFPR